MAWADHFYLPVLLLFKYELKRVREAKSNPDIPKEITFESQMLVGFSLRLFLSFEAVLTDSQDLNFGGVFLL